MSFTLYSIKWYNCQRVRPSGLPEGLTRRQIIEKREDLYVQERSKALSNVMQCNVIWIVTTQFVMFLVNLFSGICSARAQLVIILANPFPSYLFSTCAIRGVLVLS